METDMKIISYFVPLRFADGCVTIFTDQPDIPWKITEKSFLKIGSGRKRILTDFTLVLSPIQPDLFQQIPNRMLTIQVGNPTAAVIKRTDLQLELRTITDPLLSIIFEKDSSRHIRFIKIVI